jgi:mono/diheme cytochrome c family protein
MRHFFMIFSLVFFLAACGGKLDMPTATTPIPIEAIPTIDPNNTALAEGQRNYNVFCAHCHGYGGEGQPFDSIENTQSLGYHTVPLHNAAGHTWQHPRQLLFETIKYGIQNPTHLYVMTPFAAGLTDEQIFGVIDYISLWWTEEQRAWYEQVSSQFTENNPYWSTNMDEEYGN